MQYLTFFLHVKSKPWPKTIFAYFFPRKGEVVDVLTFRVSKTVEIKLVLLVNLNFTSLNLPKAKMYFCFGESILLVSKQ